MKNYLVKGFSVILSVLFLLNTSSQVFAINESTWDFYDLNNIYYYNPDGDNCTPSSSSATSYSENKLYTGEEILSASSLQKISEYRPIYEEAAKKYNFPWQILAVLHYREHSLKKSNPTNGQGIYQLYSYTKGGKNENAFLPAGDVSDEEFKRQTEITAKLIHDNYGKGLDLSTDDGVKTMFFRYNGTARTYRSQARDLGFSEAEANRGEGSPYVMNLADENRDSRKNANWAQDVSDDGVVLRPANLRPGAFLMFAALGGSTGYSSCDNNDLISTSGGNSLLNKTAVELAWPENEFDVSYSKARDSYRQAHIQVKTPGNENGKSCDYFVTTVFRYSGVDPNFECCGVSAGKRKTWNYVTNSGKFEEIPKISSLIKPGDIFLSNGHIALYVEINGVGKIADASLNRTNNNPRAGAISNKVAAYLSSPDYKVYRWKGN